MNKGRASALPTKQITMEARTIKQVNKVIQKEVGNYNLVKGEGCFYVTSEDYDLSLNLSSLYTTSIYVCHLNQQSVEAWIKDVREIVFGSNN